MVGTTELALFVCAVLLTAGVLASKASGFLGIPSLLLFLGIGMLAGSDGPGGIYFDNVPVTQAVGVVALAFILFSGGMATSWREVKPYVGQALCLSTVGTIVAAGGVGLFLHHFLHYPWLESLLLGSIVSSTDAAAVFGIVRARRVPLREDLQSVIELESGSNDPIAVFLTVGFIGLITKKHDSLVELIPTFFVEMGLGVFIGYLVGRLGVVTMRKLKLDLDALYFVLSIVVVLVAYSGTALCHGNGFLAVFIAGIVYGNGNFPQQKQLRQFHDALSWLTQIGMFLVLGLLVFPRQLPGVAWHGLLLAAVLMFVARPIGVALALLPFKRTLGEVTFIGWAGLRGAVPIVLATYPLMAGLPKAHEMFSLVFFVVLLSALLQGSTLLWVAKKLGFLEEEPVHPYLKTDSGA